MLTLPPLSLYVHVPWCIRKCPYCDFNSHTACETLPEKEYINALLNDIKASQSAIQGRPLHSMFIGGGTPSLFSPSAYERLFDGLRRYIAFSETIEITLEANPGMFEQSKFTGFRQTGINRLSIGIQSFQDDKLKRLGRIHCGEEAQHAVAMAYAAGFTNINLDLMHGLPNQSLEDALFDLKTAIALQPTHLSWYQLTIEPNTVFYSKPPALPEDEALWDIQEAGQRLLADGDYQHYEISAYSQPDQPSQHNLNYWQFGDYLGIGAGAHSKITRLAQGDIVRNWKTRLPADYLNVNKPFEAGSRILSEKELPLEFMMNALRLKKGVDRHSFNQRTGLPWRIIADSIKKAQALELISKSDSKLQPTSNGSLFLNNILAMF